MGAIIFIIVCLIIDFIYKPRVDIMDNGDILLWYNSKESLDYITRKFIYLYKHDKH